MKLEIGKTYHTRRGRKVVITRFDPEPLLGGCFFGVVQFGDNLREEFNFFEDGRFLEEPGSMIDIIGEGMGIEQ